MSRYIYFIKLKNLIFINGGSTWFTSKYCGVSSHLGSSHCTFAWSSCNGPQMGLPVRPEKRNVNMDLGLPSVLSPARFCFLLLSAWQAARGMHVWTMQRSAAGPWDMMQTSYSICGDGFVKKKILLLRWWLLLLHWRSYSVRSVHMIDQGTIMLANKDCSYPYPIDQVGWWYQYVSN
jgi:hypothetical protein